MSGGTARVASEDGVTGRKEVTSGVAAADECVCVCVGIRLLGSPDLHSVFGTTLCPSPSQCPGNLHSFYNSLSPIFATRNVKT